MLHFKNDDPVSDIMWIIPKFVILDENHVDTYIDAFAIGYNVKAALCGLHTVLLCAHMWSSYNPL